MPRFHTAHAVDNWGHEPAGGSSTGHEDDWWGQLYDESTEDTGPAPAPDSLDDRFASVAGAVGGGADSGAEAVDEGVAAAGSGVPAQRPGGAEPAESSLGSGLTRRRAPWQPQPDSPGGPETFPAGPEAWPYEDGSEQTPPDRGFTEPAVTTVPASRTPPNPPPAHDLLDAPSPAPQDLPARQDLPTPTTSPPPTTAAPPPTSTSPPSPRRRSTTSVRGRRPMTPSPPRCRPPIRTTSTTSWRTPCSTGPATVPAPCVPYPCEGTPPGTGANRAATPSSPPASAPANRR